MDQYLTFFLAGEEYAVGILKVREILAYDTPTRVPRTPAFVRGVINLRGSVVPVVDVAVKLGLAQAAVTGSTCIVIVEVESEGVRTVMGVTADAVSQVIEISAGSIEPLPAFGTRVRSEFLRGLGRVGEKLVLILDMDRVLSSDELVATAASSEMPEALAGSAA